MSGWEPTGESAASFVQKHGVHPESLAGKAYIEAAAEIASEDHKALVEKAKARILWRRGRPWWKRCLPFTIEIRFRWNWRFK